MGIFTKLFGTKNDRDIKALRPLVESINALEPSIKSLSDEDFPIKTAELKERVKNGESLDSIMTYAFALVREAAIRVLGERAFDTQVMGAIVLHQGKILEMKTGEGKTLTSTMAAYLNALEGKGVHIVTVNDYLAERDSQWMGQIFKFLGLSVGVILASMDNQRRKEAYACDITYGTNNELGFDYLRDNMKTKLEDKIQAGHHYCIIDEIDSILIDEARTPLIISGQGEDDSQKAKNAQKIVSFFKETPKDPVTGEYPQINPLERFDKSISHLDEGDFQIDEKSKHISLTQNGMQKIEDLLIKNSVIKGSLYDDENFDYVHYVTQALAAQYCYKRDTDYIVSDNKIQIVDEFTGRVLAGRRYSEGLHQAIEAKEHIKVYGLNKTIATITLQNFFRMYDKISGMTGTADTEAAEFLEIYNLDVVVVPTNKPVARIDSQDLVFLNEEFKLKAICEDIKATHETGQPILVGTISIEKSELISRLLTRMGIKHEVLNAKNHAREAVIIEEAGAKGSVTIATNMAGRGTDIKLGGSLEAMARKVVGSEAEESVLKAKMQELKPLWQAKYEEVKALGGLYVLGTERHESRRIDNQLRGRSGRQGDPGKSQFYVSFDDNLMRLFAKENVQGLLGRLGMNDGSPIEHSLVTKVIEGAQKRVEERNFDIRKHLLEYDNVLNEQREYIYGQRDTILKDKDIFDRAINTKNDIIDDIFLNTEKLSSKDLVASVYEGLKDVLRIIYPFTAEDEKLPSSQLKEKINKEFENNLNQKRQIIGPAQFDTFIRQVYLFEIDKRWQDHLDQLTELMDSVRLRTFAQKNPLTEYKLEGFQIFEQMLSKIRENVIARLLIVKVALNEQRQVPSKVRTMSASHGGMNMLDRPKNGPAVENRQQTVVRSMPKVGRNDPCPCGSGKKYKNCCGSNV